MVDRAAEATPANADAELALARLRELSADLRGCAVLGPDGETLAASGERGPWAAAAADVLAGSGGGPAGEAHAAIEGGDAFAVREGELAIVALADRDTLASLLLLDMRTVLRDLLAASAAGERQ